MQVRKANAGIDSGDAALAEHFFILRPPLLGEGGSEPSAGDRLLGCKVMEACSSSEDDPTEEMGVLF